MEEPEVGPGGPVPVPYPVEWEADVVLRDGSTTHLRPIRPQDAEAIQRFQTGQSERSAYFRFFAPVRRLTERELSRLTHVDHDDRAALVAVRPGAEPGGEDVIGVARYDKITPAEAEVAFNIADAVQGKGLGSVLLEHVAAAARERGVRRFTAEVLPQNSSMLGVFREAGYAISQHLDDGIVSVGIDLDPTERSREVMADREHRAEARSMQGLLSARRVLLVGPGPGTPTTEHHLAQRVLDAAAADPGDTELTVLDPPGPVPDVPGVRLAASWDDVPDVELALLSLPARDTEPVVRRLTGRGVRGVVVLSAGYAETGPDGLARQRELVRAAHAGGMRVVGPASFGLLTTTPGARLQASLAERAPGPGVVGLFCQSAPAAVTLTATLRRRGLGVSALVSAGHRADVSGNDLMQYFEDDPHTAVVCLYLESIGNPRKFSRIARRLAGVKPVVVVVAGRSGQVVPPGHAVRATHAPRRLLDEMLRQSGVIKAENTHQLMDVAQVLAHQPLPGGPRVGIIASSAALAALVAEAAAAAGLVVAASSDFLMPEAPDEEITRVVEALFAPGACDVVVAVDVPVVVPRTGAVARAVADAAARTGRTTVASMLGLSGLPDELAATAPDGAAVRIPAFSTPEDAVTALAKVVGYAQWRTEERGAHVRPEGVDSRAARRLVEDLLADGRGGGQGGQGGGQGGQGGGQGGQGGGQGGQGGGQGGQGGGQGGQGGGRGDGPRELGQDDAAALLGCYGLSLWRSRVVRTGDEAVAAAEELGWPVALKSASAALRHRTDLGGVRLDIADADELRADVQRMHEIAATALGEPDPLVEVQRMAPVGVACVVRSAEDLLFGPMVSFSLAGDATDLLDDVAHGVPPLTDVDVSAMVRTVRTAPRLFGYGGAPPVDIDALEDVLARVSVMADDLPELAALELYPVIVGAEGTSIVHASVRLRPAARRADALRRALPA
ncbi:GNAT family N-acetyltransferase [Isoptericola sp. NEAU-Y5]|uniref:GNAT family N-acetyltransferase n=1 Tax=Isoptericola luteus TaxID=2879484 RepID=A0ABS7ZJV7_9MICO|nr:GNAT family N-acetyltransferase [Isoptericola sp. NEAU-Y5]MCA5893904.1 GNAT family N-acetyltransferase [Isoptericola sp. NEAU-Y5]